MVLVAIAAEILVLLAATRQVSTLVSSDASKVFLPQMQLPTPFTPEV